MTPSGGRKQAWDAWACALGVVVLGWAVFSHGDARPEVLRKRAELHANAALAQAGFGWARLNIDNTAGQLLGVAPDERSRVALADEAPPLLQPYMGVPGLFLRIDNRVQLNEQLPKRPPAPPPEPEIDLLANLAPPGVGKPGTGPSMAACEKAFRASYAVNPIRFKAGSAQLEPSSMPFVQQLASLAMRCSRWRVTIEGHADATGDRTLNDRLSARRAASVAAAMILEGVPLSQLEAVGRGASSPMNVASGGQASAQNRRIEFHVTSPNKS